LAFSIEESSTVNVEPFAEIITFPSPSLQSCTKSPSILQVSQVTFSLLASEEQLEKERIAVTAINRAGQTHALLNSLKLRVIQYTLILLHLELCSNSLDPKLL